MNNRVVHIEITIHKLRCENADNGLLWAGLEVFIAM